MVINTCTHTFSPIKAIAYAHFIRKIEGANESDKGDVWTWENGSEEERERDSEKKRKGQR